MPTMLDMTEKKKNEGDTVPSVSTRLILNDAHDCSTM